MPLLVNLRLLENGPAHLQGQLTPEDLDLLNLDELIRLAGPVHHDLEAEKIEKSILVQGKLSLDLECECARCLKHFKHHLELDPWTAHLMLEGEEPVVVEADCVDLTPSVREDILLELPQRPLCQPGCRGLPSRGAGKSKSNASSGSDRELPSDWAELNKLKF